MLIRHGAPNAVHRIKQETKTHAVCGFIQTKLINEVRTEVISLVALPAQNTLSLKRQFPKN